MQEKIKVSEIVAYGKGNRVIGDSARNKMPKWRLPTDLEHFVKVTMGHIMIMGKNTWLSLPKSFRPLSGRINIIVTTDRNFVPEPTNEDVYVRYTLEDALLLAVELRQPEQEIFIMGGGMLYDQALSHPWIEIAKLYATVVLGAFEGNVFFPPIKPGLEVASIQPFLKEDYPQNTHDFNIVTYIAA